MIARLLILPLLVLLGGCKGGVIDPGNLDGSGHKDMPIIWVEGGVVYDLGTPVDAGSWEPGTTSVDLAVKPNDPCTYGQCGTNLICMANICHMICSTECGDKAPECEPTEGCHWVTSFSAVCLPGTAQYPEACGGGTQCIGGQLCVNLSGKGTMCLKLCKYGCPGGTICGSTNNNCKVCIPY